MAFPYGSNDELLSQQAILAGVTGVSAGSGALRVSTVNSFLQVSGTITLSDAADENPVSAFQAAAGNLRVSAFSNDASTFRVSALGVNITDITNTDAADLRISAFSNDAGQLRTSATLTAGSYISAMIDNGSVSAKSNDAAQLRVSAFLGAGTANIGYVSAVVDNGSVSAKSNDAAQLRVSAFLGAGTANIGYVSAVVDNGSVSAKSNDAAQFRISAFSNDGALLRVSAIQDSGTNLNVSAKSGDGALMRVSALQSAVTTATGGASTFSTSAGIGQLSAIKSSSGRLYGLYLFNRAGAAQYLQIFNVSAITSVALGTDVPALTLGVPDTGAGANMAFAPGDAFSTGIVVGVTSAPNGATAGASAMVVNIFYA